MALRIPLMAMYRGANPGMSVTQLSLPEIRSTPFTAFFTSTKNKTSSFVNATKGVDKVIKTAAATAELSKAIAIRTGAASEVVAGSSAAMSLFSDARSVLGLFNVFNGSIPSMINSAKNCKTLAGAFVGNHPSVALGIREEQEVNKEERVLITDYNKLYVGRKEMALGFIDNACGAVGSATFAAAFGGIRTPLFANKCSSFMSGPVSKGFNNTFNYLMTANHAAVLIGSSCALAHENRAYARAMKSCGEGVAVKARLTEVHKCVVLGHILNSAEKIADFFLDVFKIIPSITPILPLEAKAVLGLLIGMIGVYKIWRFS